MTALYVFLTMFSIVFILQEIFFCFFLKDLSVSSSIVKKYIIQEDKDGTFSAKRQNRFCFIPIKQYKDIESFSGSSYYRSLSEAKDALDKHLFKPKKEKPKVHSYKQSTPKPEIE